MWTLKKSIDLDMAHHVSGHHGACINVHGHTWKFEVTLVADELDELGFVVDFKELKRLVLEPVHKLLDHALVLSEVLYDGLHGELSRIGKRLLATRSDDYIDPPLGVLNLLDADQRFPGGMKMAVFSFNPTSERLAQWLYRLTAHELLRAGHSPRVRVWEARVFETLHPVESIAAYMEVVKV